jgi:type I restriction enzyme R subunit
MSNNLTEEDTKFRFITPAIEKAGWEKEQIKMEFFFTDGVIKVQGNDTKRGQRKKADYLLHHVNNFPLAIVEAKNNNYSIGDGMQQGLSYAKILDVPFVYSSNG